MEVYLIGLFVLVQDRQGRPACVGQAVVMLLALGATIT